MHENTIFRLTLGDLLINWPPYAMAAPEDLGTATLSWSAKHIIAEQQIQLGASLKNWLGDKKWLVSKNGLCQKRMS